MKIRERLDSSKKIVAITLCGALVLGAVGFSTANTSVAEAIGPEQAAEVALKNAGLEQTDVKKLSSRYDKEDGKEVYEVGFYADGMEYDYKVAVKDGTILELQKEKMDAEDYREAGLEVPKSEKKETKSTKKSSEAKVQTNTASTQNVTAQTAPASSQSTPEYIGESAAKKVALKHAGVSSDKATFAKVKLEKDDGVYEYDIKFYANGYEYEYEVKAVDGKILKADKERDDDAPKSQNQSQTNDYISKDAAKKEAYKHAGVDAANVSYTKAEMDKDDGIVKYEVEFVSGDIEYEYEINAKTGKVISAERDYRD